MAIDPNIVFQLKQPQIENPVNALTNVLKLQQAQQGSQMDALKIDEYKRSQAGENALAKLLSQGGSPEDVARGLATQGYGKQSMDYTKQQQELLKNKAAAEKDLLANTHKKLEIGSQLLSGATDQATYDAARAQAQSMGIDFSKLPPQFDPAFVQRTVQQGIDMKTQLEEKWRATVAAETARHNKTTEGLTAQGQQIQIRGQNLTDARTRESTAATVGKPFEVTGPDGTPVLVRQDKQGNLTPVQGFGPKQGASKPLNEGQSKALLFGSRMQEANAIFDELEASGTTKSIPGSRTPIVGRAVTAIGGESNQKLEQAKRDFINATLRRESGAAIAESEFDNAEKQYFPQIGDSQAVIAQKKRNREVATRGILAEVPDSANRVKAVRGGSTVVPEKTQSGATASNW